MKKYIIKVLKILLSKLDKQKPLQQEAIVRVKKGRVSKRIICPVVLKVSYDEKRSKEKAKITKSINKIRAYKCEFCPYWHLTHKKNKLNFH